MDHHPSRFLLLFTVIALLAGCGQTGQLYLPEDPEATEETEQAAD